MGSRNSKSNHRRIETLPVGGLSHGEGPSEQLQVPVVDFAENDEDVVEISPTIFAQAVANTRRTRKRIGDSLNMNMGNQTMPTNFMNNGVDHTYQPIADINLNLELGLGSISQVIEKKEEEKPSFKCPICMEALVDEMSTICGHIFCKMCIKRAISLQGKCPTCRRKLLQRHLIRVFLSSPSN